MLVCKCLFCILDVTGANLEPGSMGTSSSSKDAPVPKAPLTPPWPPTPAEQQLMKQQPPHPSAGQFMAHWKQQEAKATPTLQPTFKPVAATPVSKPTAPPTAVGTPDTADISNRPKSPARAPVAKPPKAPPAKSPPAKAPAIMVMQPVVPEEDLVGLEPSFFSHNKNVVYVSSAIPSQLVSNQQLLNQLLPLHTNSDCCVW